MTQVNTADLTGTALDWAVTKCEGKAVSLLGGDVVWREVLAYSTKWAYGGPIIEREWVSVVKVDRSLDDSMAPHHACWCAHIDGIYCRYGDSALTAAMRCYVASKLGDVIDIPEELL